MNGTEVNHPLAGGIQTLQPQDPSNASIAQNLTREESGWSTRLGYEKFDPDLSNGMGAFASVGAVYSIYVHQALAGGARQEILFEADGTLYYAYDAAGAVLLRTIASDRHIPTITEPASTYTSTPHGVLVTNGVDQPLLVSLWPLGTSQERALRPSGVHLIQTPSLMKVSGAWDSVETREPHPETFRCLNGQSVLSRLRVAKAHYRQ